MTSDYNPTWTAYENELYVAHQLKLLRPPPGPETDESASLPKALYWQSRLVQEARDILDHVREPDKLDALDLIASQLLDFHTHLSSRDILLCTSHLHHGVFMAVKVKGLKALRGVGPENRRTTIMRALSAVVRECKHVGFGGYLSRFYVLLNAPWKARILARLLVAELNDTLQRLGLDDLEDPPRPHLLFGVGRTWEEAHLVTRGRIIQADVPIDLKRNEQDC